MFNLVTRPQMSVHRGGTDFPHYKARTCWGRALAICGHHNPTGSARFQSKFGLKIDMRAGNMNKKRVW